MSSTTTTTMKFDSEGFDLDAAVSNMNLSSSTTTTTAAGNKEAEVIYEIGGRAATTTATTSTRATSLTNHGDNTMLQLAESLKEQGNEYYKNHNYIAAYEKYAAAIRTIEEERVEEEDEDNGVVDGASPITTATSKTKVMTGQEILKKKDLWEQEQHLRLRNELRQRDSQKDDHNRIIIGIDITTTRTTTAATICIGSTSSLWYDIGHILLQSCCRIDANCGIRNHHSNNTGIPNPIVFFFMVRP